MIKPFVKISENDWNKIIKYARTTYDMYSAEIGGMAHAFINNGVWTIKDPVILKQTISGGNCTIDKEALAEYYTDSVKDYNKLDLTANKFLYVWWHSHHNMKAFWSGTDEQTIEDAAKHGPSMSLVVNNKEDYELRYTFKEPIEAYVDCDLKIMRKTDDPIRKEIEELCTLTTIGKNMINELENEKTIRSGLEHQADMFDDVLNNYEYNPIMQEEISGALYDDKRVYMIEESSNDINDILIDYMAESINYSAFRTLIEDINDKYGVYDISYKIPPKKDMHKVSATTLLKESKNKEAN